MSSEKYGNENYELWLRRNCKPVVSFEVEEFEYKGCHIVIFEIQAALAEPVYFKESSYVRVGSNLTKLSRFPDFLRRIYNSQKDWSAEIVKDATIDDLDPVAILKAREKYKEVHPGKEKEVDEWDDQKFLNKAHITIKNKITMAAIILLGREESEHYLLPSVCKIRWSLKNEKGENLDFKVFSIPMILAIEDLEKQIRNTTYEFTISGNIFPEKLMRYDEFTLREPLNNAIAHQDYNKGARIEVIEYENDHLVFRNHGIFLPGSAEKVVLDDCPESIYRNPWLVEAMQNVHMVDTEGGGIKKLYEQQKKRFFPMPEYDFSDRMVTVNIEGKVIDERFARILVSVPDLSMSDLILLDKVQKQKRLTDDEIKYLKKKKYIEGRKSNPFLSRMLTKETGNVGLKSTYVKNKSFDDEYFRRLIVQYIEKFGAVSRAEVVLLLKDKLSEALTDKQKENKITNLLSYLRIHHFIKSNGKRKWILD